jgi:hypothetical protein
MQAPPWRDRLLPWLPAAFAASLSVITLPIMVGARDISAYNSALIPFLSFLPMCFFFNAVAIVALRQRINELQRRLDEREPPTTST